MRAHKLLIDTGKPVSGTLWACVTSFFIAPCSAFIYFTIKNASGSSGLHPQQWASIRNLWKRLCSHTFKQDEDLPLIKEELDHHLCCMFFFI